MKLVRNLEVIMARREQGEGEDVAFAQMEAFAKARQRRFDRIQAENEVRFCLFVCVGFCSRRVCNMLIAHPRHICTWIRVWHACRWISVLQRHCVATLG